MKFMKCNQPGKDLIHWSEKERKKSKKKKEKEEPTQDDGLVEIERDGNTSARTLLRHRLVWSSSVKKGKQLTIVPQTEQPGNPSINISELHKTCRSTDFEVIKLQNVRSGSGTTAATAV